VKNKNVLSGKRNTFEITYHFLLILKNILILGFFLGGAALGFEFRASHLLGRHLLLGSSHQSYIEYFKEYFIYSYI
jgi:hypothetical protein